MNAKLNPSIVLAMLPVLICLAGCSSLPDSTLDEAFVKRYHRYQYCQLQATRQTWRYSCGPACMATILTYWDRYTTEREVIQGMRSFPEKGCRLSELKQIAEDHGLQAFVLSMRDSPRSILLEQMGKGRPVVCAVRYPRGYTPASDLFFIGPVCSAVGWVMGTRVDHFVVVFGYQDDSLLIMDPAAGIVDLDWEQFEPCWQEQQYAALVVAR